MVVTCILDHYLACDKQKQKLYLVNVSNRSDVEAGKYPELNFR